jgi:hypothetical protein
VKVLSSKKKMVACLSKLFLTNTYWVKNDSDSKPN